jgi:DNA-binding NarL/FixJ family response regulator
VKPNSVLIVDDNSAIRHSLRRAFEKAGWLVCGEAGNGREAVAKADELHPQVIVLGIAMPEMNGIAAARILKQKMHETHLIVFTMNRDLIDGRSQWIRNFRRAFKNRIGNPIVGEGWKPRGLTGAWKAI